MRKGLKWVLFFSLSMGVALADNTIKSIRYQGLHRYTQASLASKAEIAVGQPFNQALLSKQIKAFYATQYFETITTQFDQGKLIFKFKERPVIAEIEFTGNSVFSDKQLEKPVASADIKPGRPFLPSALQRLVASLKHEYRSMGYLSVAINPKITRIAGSKVMIDVQVEENQRAYYDSVKFSGNRDFSSGVLRWSSQMQPWSIYSYLRGTSIYSPTKFDASVKALYEFYYDHGYLNFDILNKAVKLNDKKTQADVAIKLYEGQPYTLTKIDIDSPIQLPTSIAMLQASFEKQTYARTNVLKLIDAIQDYLKDAGYAYANIKPVQKLNRKSHTVHITLVVQPEKIYQIRKIEFHGNDLSNTTMLRRYLYLNEGQRFSKKELEASKNKLMALGYFENVVYRVNPVPGFDHMVDIDYSIVEKDSVNSLMAEVGYGRNAGITLGSDLKFNNFFGTGNQVTLGLKSTQSSFVANLSHVDPFFTDYAITRSTNLYYTWVDSDDIRASDYRAENIGASMMFGLPVSRYTKIDMGVNLEHSIFKDSSSYSTQVQNFIDQHGSLYNNVAFKLGLSNSHYETSYRNVFNVSLEVGLPVINHYLTYYTLNASNRFRVDLYNLNPKDKFAFEVTPHIGYGQGYNTFAGELPFFKMFHAGGYGSVRNYKNFSLGPRDSKGDVLGGDLLTTVGTNLYFPLPFIEDNPFKTAFFFDMGNVYKNSFSASNLRGSYGIMFLIKMGQVPIGFTLAQPINSQPDDSFNVFDFALGIDF